jgi:hypothetical protein
MKINDAFPGDFADVPDDAVLAEKLSSLSDTIRAGQNAVTPRAVAIRTAARAGWTQNRIADQCGISQVAVSKTLAKTPGETGIETCRNQHYLLGRLLRIAAQIGWCAQGEDGRVLADKLFAGERPVTEISLAALRHQLDKHLRKISVTSLMRGRAQAALNDIDVRTTGTLPRLIGIDQKWRMMLGWHHQGSALFDTEGESHESQLVEQDTDSRTFDARP